MRYAEFAQKVLLEAMSLKTWDQLSPRGSKIRRFVRGIRRARESLEIASLDLNSATLGDKIGTFLSKSADRRIKATKAISGSRVPGNKKYVK